MQTENFEPTQQTPVTQPVTREPDVDMTTMAPGTIRVIKRNGTVVPYDDEKVRIAITKAFLEVEGGNAAASNRIRETVSNLTRVVSTTFRHRMPSGGNIHIEEIQDQVELALMRTEEHKVARSYVLYREERAQQRKDQNAPSGSLEKSIRVTKSDGSQQPLDKKRLAIIVNEACQGLEDVDSAQILDEVMRNLYDGVPASEVGTSLVMTARTLVEKEPNYSRVTARLLLDQLRTEALSFLNVAEGATQTEMSALYKPALKAYITRGIALELLAPELQEFDIDQLGEALDPQRDLQFNYLGLQTLYDRYFIHSNDIRFELPQIFFMRVAMGLASQEQDKNARAIEFYRLLSSFDYMCSTPTLFNAGTLRPQLSSCYLTTVPDDLHGIYGAIQDNAMLSKWAGGLGNDWTPVRALGSYIKGTNGKSQGVVPFLKVVNDTAVAVNQGGKRKGAVCAYLESWHLDIEEFLELRKNTGDDRRRTHDMNTANWVPDLFMKRLCNEQEWTLFSPNDVPDLHDLYGAEFEQRYLQYEAMTETGELALFKRVKAVDLWRKMLSMLFETGHPWITFKDPCNLRSPQQHTGVVHSSNLCTEITLNTNADEIAVCNLGSVNLANHTSESGVDMQKLQRTVTTAVRMLDNVIDINYYSVDQARASNMRHRPVGLGLMGFQDALYKQNLAYASAEAVEFADRSMEAISYFAIQASSQLAVERGPYTSYQGSLWSQGILPIDSIQLLVKNRGREYAQIDESRTLDWDTLRQQVTAQGMRNSNVMAIAPTATIANITGVSQSIEPTYQNLYVKSNLSGEFTVVNPYLVHDLKARKLWNEVMVDDLKHFEGSVAHIDMVPADLKHKYATAFEVEPRWIVEAASRRQKWIDQAQSLNLYIDEPNGEKLDITYKMAWLSGLKTTYYLRSLAATTIEKSTDKNGSGGLNEVNANSVDPNAVAAFPASAAGAAAATGEADFTEGLTPQAAPKACALDDPSCGACE